jgi:hypothetical protein
MAVTKMTIRRQRQRNPTPMLALRNTMIAAVVAQGGSRAAPQ